MFPAKYVLVIEPIFAVPNENDMFETIIPWGTVLKVLEHRPQEHEIDIKVYNSDLKINHWISGKDLDKIKICKATAMEKDYLLSTMRDDLHACKNSICEGGGTHPFRIFFLTEEAIFRWLTNEPNLINYNYRREYKFTYSKNEDGKQYIEIVRCRRDTDDVFSYTSLTGFQRRIIYAISNIYGLEVQKIMGWYNTSIRIIRNDLFEVPEVRLNNFCQFCCPSFEDYITKIEGFYLQEDANNVIEELIDWNSCMLLGCHFSLIFSFIKLENSEIIANRETYEQLQKNITNGIAMQEKWRQNLEQN